MPACPSAFSGATNSIEQSFKEADKSGGFESRVDSVKHNTGIMPGADTGDGRLKSKPNDQMAASLSSPLAKIGQLA
jgi:hypothetical protein